jgi:hypothetical protein
LSGQHVRCTDTKNQTGRESLSVRAALPEQRAPLQQVRALCQLLALASSQLRVRVPSARLRVWSRAAVSALRLPAVLPARRVAPQDSVAGLAAASPTMSADTRSG